MNMMKLGLFCGILFSTLVLRAADTLELPEEELAKESVTPIFDHMVSVKNRNVVSDKHLEFGGYYGWALTEPIANVSKLGINLYYHLDEDQALGVFLNKNFSGLSSYANQLNSQFSLDFNRAPKPDLTLMADYNLIAYYGKISISKNSVYNLQAYGSLSGGVVKYEHKTYPGVAAGIGQKFFFTNKFSFRVDLRLFINNAPIPFKPNAIKTSDPVPALTDFDERITYTTVLDLGLSYLF